MCTSARKQNYYDTGSPAVVDGDDQCNAVVVSTGTCAGDTSTFEACDDDHIVCHANTGLSSWGGGNHFWYTFAHELGHNVGGAHTMAQGGIMSYTDGEKAFYDNGALIECRLGTRPTTR